MRDELAVRFYKETEAWLADPWAARDAYIDVVLDGSPAARDAFLARQAPDVRTSADRQLVWRLLESQRHAMLMFTSCGWFFDDVDGIEARQILRYAGRAIETGGTAQIAERFKSALERAASNRAEAGTARAIFENELMLSRVEPAEIAAWWAAASSVAATGGSNDTRPAFPAWDVSEEVRREDAVDGVRLVTGRVRVRSLSLEDEDRFDFAALFRFSGDLWGGIRPAVSDETETDPELPSILREHGVAGVLTALDEHYALERIGMETLSRLRRSQPDHRAGALASYAAEALPSLAHRWTEHGDVSALDIAESMLDIIQEVPATPDLWEAQNAWFVALERATHRLRADAPEVEHVSAIASRLGISSKSG